MPPMSSPRVAKICCALAASLSGLLPVGAVCQEPRANVGVRHWGVEDGLPQGSVTGIAQTPDGFLWLATFGGLVRFDGVSPQTQTGAPTEQGTNFRVTAVVADPSGGLWVGLQSGGISRFVDGRWTRPAQPEALAGATVWQLGMTDRPWAATEVGVARWTGTAFVLQERPGKASGIVVDADTVWVGSVSGLSRVRGGRVEDVFIDRSVSAMCAGQRGLWVAGDGWLGHWTDDGLHVAALPVTDAHPWALSIDASGDVWMATDAGLYVVGADVEGISGVAPVRWPEPRMGARSLFRDREGNLWAGANGEGVYGLRRDAFERRRLGAGHRSSVGGVAGDGQGGAIVTGECRQLFRVRSGIVTTLPRVPGDRCVGALAVDARGHLWVGAGASLAEYTLAGDDLVEVSRRPMRADIAALAPAPDAMWVGTLGEGLAAVRAAGDRWYSVKDGLAHSHVTAVVVDGDAVWAGHPSGTTLVRPEAIHTLTEADGHPPGSVRALLPDTDGAIWIGTYGGGLARWHRGEFWRFSRADGLLDDVVSSIVDDGLGSLWMNGNRGVSWVSRRELEAFADGRIRSVRAPSLATGEGNGFVQPTGLRAPDGLLSFPTVNGLVQLRPDNIAVNAAVPTVFIESASVDGVPLVLGATTTVPPGDGELVARFTSPSLRRPELIRFQYRLSSGSPTVWTPADGRGLHLHKLSPGEDTLAVRATNENDVVSSAAVVRFRLEPAFHQTVWFQLLLFAALIACGVMLQMIRTRRLARHAAALREEIEQRKAAEVALRDEGERRLGLERQLAHAARMEAIGTLAGGVAHDFNNLLTVISNYTVLLRREVDPGAGTTIDSYIEEIARCAERAARLTRQLLAFGRRQNLQPVVCSPVAVVEGLSAVLARLGPNGVNLSLSLDADAGYVLADPSGLENVLVNLVLNAAQAKGDVAAVHIAVGRMEGEESVQIEVRDDGPGIPDDVMPHIFEPFFTTKGVGQGTGLGLASAHGFVSQSKGVISVISAPGAGTVFRIVLPRVPAPAEAEREAALSSEACPRAVLLVDDDDAVRRSLRRLLRGRRIDVTEAASGAEALELLSGGKVVGAMVTDIRMPGMSGVELAERAEALHPGLRVLFISGHVTPGLVEQLDRHGGRLLEKPFDPEVLVARVEELLGPAA